MKWATRYFVAVMTLTLGCAIAPPVEGEPDEVAAKQTAAAEPLQDRTLKLPSDPRHTLWIPGDYQRSGKTIDALIDFHGDPPRVRSSARLAGLHCVVISVTYAGLSSVYRVPFSEDRQLFTTILDEALAALRTEPDFPDDAQWNRLAITSFSAGFGAVREILKTQDYFDRIAGIYMVDSLYCGYVGEGTDTLQAGAVDPGLMKDFLRFAQAAANGEKVMIITHCSLPTPGYASTLETADYLLEQLQLTPQQVDTLVQLPPEAKVAPGVLRLYRQAERKGFAVYGSPGTEATDHLAHLWHMAYWLPKLPLDKRGSDTEVD